MISFQRGYTFWSIDWRRECMKHAWFRFFKNLMLEIQFSIILFFSIHFQVVQGVYQPEDCLKKSTKDVSGMIFFARTGAISVQNRAKIFLQKSIFLNAQCCLPVQTTEMLVVQSHWSMKKVPSSGLDAGTLCVNAFFFSLLFSFWSSQAKKFDLSSKYALKFSRKHILQHSIKYTLIGNISMPSRKACKTFMWWPMTQWCSCQTQMFFRPCSWHLSFKNAHGIWQSSRNSMDNRWTKISHMPGGQSKDKPKHALLQDECQMISESPTNCEGIILKQRKQS